MRRRQEPLTAHLAFRAPPALLARLAVLAAMLSAPHHKATRSEIGRGVFDLGLAQFDERHYAGRRRRGELLTDSVAFRVSAALLAHLDGLAAKLSTPHREATRSEVAGAVFDLGLSAFEARSGNRSRRTTRSSPEARCG